MAPAQAAPEPMYRKDEKVLCFHHELLYDAKVLDVRPGTEDDKAAGFHYKVHYKGWKNTWDDWVPESRLKKISPESRELANQLRQTMLAEQRAAQKAPAPVAPKKKVQGSNRGSEERQTSVAAAGPRGQKRVRDQDLEREETFQARRAVRIPMPDRLKSLLVDDWENVTKNLQVVQLPSKIPAGVILDEYFEAEKVNRQTQADLDILEETVSGLKEYFNRSLGRILLYRFEREQLFDINADIENPTSDLAGKTYIDIYGGEHLLRLLVSMPELIAQTNMDAQSVGRLRDELINLLGWCCAEPQVNSFFHSVYESPGQAYIDKVKNNP